FVFFFCFFLPAFFFFFFSIYREYYLYNIYKIIFFVLLPHDSHLFTLFFSSSSFCDFLFVFIILFNNLLAKKVLVHYLHLLHVVGFLVCFCVTLSFFLNYFFFSFSFTRLMYILTAKLSFDDNFWSIFFLWVQHLRKLLFIFSAIANFISSFYKALCNIFCSNFFKVVRLDFF
ncbi:hypothetical protein CpipJ_CPIJ013540, partial [Culex quinquefasciatus]